MDTPKSLYNMLNSAHSGVALEDLNAFIAANDLEASDLGKAQEKYRDAFEATYALWTGKDLSGNEVEVPQVSLESALSTNDAPRLFTQVVRTILREPTEPNLFLSNSVAQPLNLRLEGNNLIEIIRLGAVQAFEMNTGQDYRSALPPVAEDNVKIGMRKFGVIMPLADEVQRNSNYPLATIYLRLGRAAMDRKMEQELYKTMQETATVVYDNESVDTNLNSTGVSSANAANFTMDWQDVNTMLGVIVGNMYNPSHVLTHPLGWPIFANDPYLRATFYHQGQVGSQIHTTMPQFDQQVNMPYSMSFVPYYGVEHSTAQLATGAGSALAATLLVDVYAIDARNSLYQANWGGIEVDNYNDFFKDVNMLKLRKFANFAAKDGGKPMARAKKMRVDTNYKPLFTVRTVTS
jgi:hypothetical protein